MIRELLRSGRLDEAEAAIGRVAPGTVDADLLHYRGILALKRGRAAEAAVHLRHAAAVAPGRADILSNLGAALRAAGDPAAAARSYAAALAIAPDLAETAYNLGNLRKDAGAADSALAAHRRALVLNPAYAKNLYNMGVIEMGRRRLEVAARCYRRALAAAGDDYPEAWNNLGMTTVKLGRPDEALECYERVLAHRPDDVSTRWNRALARLVTGRLEEGWADYEARWGLDEVTPPAHPQPLWQGEDLAGCTLLVEAEQGHGDTLQFVRYLPRLAARGVRVVLRCQPPLVRLLAPALPGVRVLSRDEEPPPFDLHVPLLSLPLRFGTGLDAIPADIPYLHPLPGPPPTVIERQPGTLSVGLVWGGEPNHKGDAQRSIPLPALRPLLEVKGVRWYSLQKGVRERELAAADAPPGIADLAPFIGDFADTAALAAQLDLVVSVDTAVCHLAGALGRPAWVLVPFAPDWRWLLSRTDTPWYPTLRLFRQPALDDWASLIPVVASRLAAVASGRLTALDMDRA